MAEDADRARKQREDLGVELYGMQQQLARLQTQLESTHNNSHLISDIRKKAETDLERMREVRGPWARDGGFVVRTLSRVECGHA